MNKDRVKGKLDDVAGRANRQVGEWTGDTKTQVEGAAQQVKGKVENAWGKMKDAAREAEDKVKAPSRQERGEALMRSVAKIDRRNGRRIATSHSLAPQTDRSGARSGRLVIGSEPRQLRLHTPLPSGTHRASGWSNIPAKYRTIWYPSLW